MMNRVEFYRIGFPILRGYTMNRVFNVLPTMQNNKDIKGLALDGRLKDEDTNLASSTV